MLRNYYSAVEMLQNGKRGQKCPDSDSPISKLQHKSAQQTPSIDQFVTKRDFTGALTLLELQNSRTRNSELWVAYNAYHMADYRRAADIYEKIAKTEGKKSEIWTYLACSYFMMGMYTESQMALKQAPKSPLKNRLNLHLSYKLMDEKMQTESEKGLAMDDVEDQLSLAASFYSNGEYSEAVKIYRKILEKNSECLAVFVYLAMCYHKMDYFDSSDEMLANYLRNYPDSLITINLHACNQFKLKNARAAQVNLNHVKEMSPKSFMFGREIINHNAVAFGSGTNTIQVFQELVDVIVPEARQNLACSYLKKGEAEEALKLLQAATALKSQDVNHLIPLAVAYALIGQTKASFEHVHSAVVLFQRASRHNNIQDTIVGRQCLASAAFLTSDFNEVIRVLDSIRSFNTSNDDTFNYNYGQAKMAVGSYVKAIECLLAVSDEDLVKDYTLCACLARSYIMIQKPAEAFTIWHRLTTSSESYLLLDLIANECYRTGQFYYAARSFSILDSVQPTVHTCAGKFGACIGLFQKIVAGQESDNLLLELVQMLGTSTHAEAETVVSLIKSWAMSNDVALDYMQSYSTYNLASYLMNNESCL